MKKKEIATLLGSNKPIPVENKKLDGPLTYLNLIREVETRLQPKRVGRPSDVKETKYHNIPLTSEVWGNLNKKAKLIPGKKTLSASQLAAFLIEDGLKKLDSELKGYGMEKNP